jgi:hypothetical protein
MKPIFIIGLPNDIREEVFEMVLRSHDKKLYDYHVLVYKRKDLETSFQCFHEKDIVEADLNELKQTIKDNIWVDAKG